MKTRKLKLKSIIKSHLPNKKWDATFVYRDGHTKNVPFGARKQINGKWGNMSDYTKHKDKTRRARYLKRHAGMGESWNKPDTAGALSKWILWGPSTSFRKNVQTFKRRFNL
jgi:hypothetical protein